MLKNYSGGPVYIRIGIYILSEIFENFVKGTGELRSEVELRFAADRDVYLSDFRISGFSIFGSCTCILKYTFHVLGPKTLPKTLGNTQIGM